MYFNWTFDGSNVVNQSNLNDALTNKVNTMDIILEGSGSYDYPIGNTAFKSLFITGWVSGVGAVADLVVCFSDNEGTSISLNGQNNVQYDLSRAGYIKITNPNPDWRYFRGRLWWS